MAGLLDQSRSESNTLGITPKHRVLAAMQHQFLDRAPLFYRDVPEVEVRLRRDLGLPDREALLAYFEIDFRWVEPEYVGSPLGDGHPECRRSIWGVEYVRQELDQGAYWRPAAFPLQGATEPAALEDYPWPQAEWFDYSTLPAQIERYRDYAIMTAPGTASTGVLSVIQDLLGMERAMTDPLIRPAFFEKLVEKILAFKLPFVERMVTAAEGGIDFFRIGDDFGTQRGLLMGIPQWRTWLAPALKAVASTAKRAGARYYYHHSCGAIRALLPELIDLGVDVVDPVQVRANGMEPESLVAEYGERLCFSGGIDEQELLPRGTPEQVRAEVFRICETLGRRGGYFVGPTHNFQEDVPTENIVAMYEAARQWRP